MKSNDRAEAAAAHFALDGQPASLQPHTGGHINSSWLLTTAPSGRRYLLQRINRTVFHEPVHVMENVLHVTEHIGGPLLLVPTAAGARWLEEEGEVWRCFPYIEGTVTRQEARGPEDARMAGLAFGDFQRSLAGYAGPPLHETIPGFHDTLTRVRALEQALDSDPSERAGEPRVEQLVAELMEWRELAHALDGASRGIAHNDAKLANVLLDAATGEPRCVVDLDTVMPGLPLHDIGDLIRSTAASAPEDAPDPAMVVVRPDVVAAAARGFVEGAGDALARRDRELIATAAAVMAFEQSVRFLTDYLEGDVYYRTTRPGQNLDRARTQAALVAGIHRAEGVVRAGLDG